MASKEYHFPHELKIQEARERTEHELGKLASEYGLAIQPNEDGFSLAGKGIDATVTIDTDALSIRLDLPFLLEKTLRSRIEKNLFERMKTVLA